MNPKSGAQFAGIVAAHDAAQLALDNYRNFSLHNLRGCSYDPKEAELEIAFLESKLAIQEGGAAYNRSSADLELLRKLAESELKTARDQFAKLEAQVPQLPRGPAVDANVQERLDRNDVIRSLGAQRRPIIERLAAVFREIEQQMSGLRHQRKADKLPQPVAVLDFRLLQNTGYLYADSRPIVPHTSDQCSSYLESIASQRVPNPRNGRTGAEAHLYDLRNALASYKQRQADAIEKSEAVLDGTYQQAAICGMDLRTYKRDRDARKAVA